MASRKLEIMVGVFVALGLAALFMLAMRVSNLSAMTSDESYDVVAFFDNVGGLKVRSPVTASGVLVGRVSKIEYDPELFQAKVTLHIQSRFDRFPLDTSASIFTAGLLGEQYIGLQVGAEEDYLGPGEEIRLTQSALVLEQVIGQFLFSKAAE